MRLARRDTALAVTLLVLATAAAIGGAALVDARVLRRADQRALVELLERARLPADRVVLAHPAEALFPLAAGVDLAAWRLVLVSQHTATFPLYLLQGQPAIFLLRDTRAPPRRLNLASLPSSPVAEADGYRLDQIPLALLRWQDDLAQFEVNRVEQGRLSPATRDGEAFVYGPQRWHRLHRKQGTVDKLEFPCLAVHPDPGFALRVASPLPPATRLAQLHLAGLDSGDRRKENRYTLQVRVRAADRRELRQQVREIPGSQLKRWETVELDTRGGAWLELELAVNRGGRHHLCLMGDLLR